MTRWERPLTANEITLGDPRSNKTTMSWLGVETLRVGETGPLATSAQAEQSRTAPGDPAPGATQQLVVRVNQAIANAAQQTANTIAETLARVQSSLNALAPVLRVQSEEIQSANNTGDDVTPAIESPQLEAEAEETPPTPTESSPQPARQDDQPNTAGAPPSPVGGGDGAGGQDGSDPDAPEPTDSPTDRDVPATSVNSEDLGQPLSAGGLRIITKRPSRSIYSEIVSGSASVTVAIYFDKSGKATLVQLKESSGKSSIDNPVLNAAYEWRAIPHIQGGQEPEVAYTIPESGVVLTFRIRL